MGGRLPITDSAPSRFWTIAIGALVIVTIAGVVIAATRCRPSRPLEISLPEKASVEGSVQVGGAVANPGVFPLRESDTIEDLIAAAGGRTAAADGDQLRLTVPEAIQTEATQRININRAEAWLLEALPGIGPSRAAAIVEDRLKNGPFGDTSDLTRISGIGPALLADLEPFITVID